MSAVMTPTLHNGIARLLTPLFTELPLDRAMPMLVVDDDAADAAHPDHPDHPRHIEMVEAALASDALQGRSDLAAGLWLYIDELDRSHSFSQKLATPTGSFWHAIMHRREGDFSNSKYWYRRVGQHPVYSHIDPAGGGAGAGTDVADYDPFNFVDRTERAYRRGEADEYDLVSLQRREWTALFEWCAER